MFPIYFYRDAKGREPVKEFLIELANKNTKDSRISLNKINDYLELLSQEGTRIGRPFVKYMGDDLWELRPLKNRIFFVSLSKQGFILLHHFHKKSQKTPKKELLVARKRLKELQKEDLL